jgi:hypothetical protein
MSENGIYGSGFLFVSLVSMYLYWVKEHSYIFQWRTVGALVMPVLFRYSVCVVEDYLLHPTLFIRIPLEICVYVATSFLLMNSFKYFASLSRFLPIPSVCKGCSYYHGMDIICAVHPQGPVENICNDYRL